MTTSGKTPPSRPANRPARRSWAEPWKVKMVEPIKMLGEAERHRALADSGYNTFLLRSEDVYIDLLTDSGTNAMSDWQWAGMMLGDEAYAGSRNFYNLEEAVQQHYGYRYMVPTHQGRGAENLLSRMLIKAGDIVPGNMYFTTTRLHQELAGGEFVDVIVREAHDPTDESPFKGNVDLAALEALIRKVGARRIPYVCVAGTVNMAGGQPISMANMRALRELTQRHGIRVVLDATRAAENAWFIKQREDGYAGRSVAEILKEFCSYTDACTMSGKKDALVNIGGWLAVNDPDLYEEASNLVVVYEGLHTYGGMAGRDMEAMARGIVESVQDAHMAARVGQVQYLGQRLIDMGIPVVQADRRSRRVPGRQGLLPAHPAGPVPGAGAGGQPVRRLGRTRHGARHRLGRPRRGHRRAPLPGPRAGAPDHPAARLHAGAHGRDRRVGGGRVRQPPRDGRPQDGVRTALPEVLPGALRAPHRLNAVRCCTTTGARGGWGEWHQAVTR